VEVAGHITTAIVLCFMLFIMCAAGYALLRSLLGPKKQPKLAGTVIPELGQGLDISKHFDIVYSGGDHGSHIVERLQGVRILGYVGNDSDQSVGKMYMRSRWLVVEVSDGRRAYLMPHAIVSLLESMPL
jgi:hypothetical protein